MTTSNGKSSGSWKAWKSCVAWWVKSILIAIGIALASLLGLFVTYKSIHALRISSLMKQIGEYKGKIDALSF
jgi:hypothetical protein